MAFSNSRKKNAKCFGVFVYEVTLAICSRLNVVFFENRDLEKFHKPPQNTKRYYFHTSIHTYAIKPSVYISGQWCCDIICRLTLCRLPISLCCLALPASPYSKTISVFEKKKQPTYRPTDHHQTEMTNN